MDSLTSILFEKNFEVPPEISAIKAYVKRHFQTDVSVKVGPHAIIVTAGSAALIGSLRMHIRQLQACAGTDKKVILRVGNYSE